MAALFAHFDTDADGVISWEEFATALSEAEGGEVEGGEAAVLLALENTVSQEAVVVTDTNQWEIGLDDFFI